MQASISKLLETTSRSILALTLYGKMLSSRDFQDVKEALNDRTNWSIELVSTFVHFTLQHLSPLHESLQFRSCFTYGTITFFPRIPRLMLLLSIHCLSNDGSFLMLCALFFLVIAENIHMNYGRLSAAELKVQSCLTWRTHLTTRHRFRNALSISVTRRLRSCLRYLTLDSSSFVSLDSLHCRGPLFLLRVLSSLAYRRRSFSRCSPTLRGFSSGGNVSPLGM